MRLYAGKISLIAQDLVRELTTSGDVELEDENEARLDIEAVLKEQVRTERRLSDEAKNRMEQRGMSYETLGRVKASVAKERRVAHGDEVLPFLVNQLLNMLFHSQNVAEVFAEDTALRRRITQTLRRHMEVETELDQMVRSKIKNLEEGTSTFEIEYARVMDQMKRRRGLSEG